MRKSSWRGTGLSKQAGQLDCTMHAGLSNDGSLPPCLHFSHQPMCRRRHCLPTSAPAHGAVFSAAGGAASYSMTTAAGSMHVALRAVGTRGEASAERGGGAAKGRAFRLVQLLGGQATPAQVSCRLKMPDCGRD